MLTFLVADAAHMLEQYGSAQSETTLWQALERWHERWKGQAAKLERDHENPDGMPLETSLERDLTQALMQGTAWLMDESSAHRLGSLCLTTYCRESIGQVFRDLANTPSIMIRPSTLPLGEPNIAVYEKTFVRFSSRDAFHQSMALHAEGTTFSWPDQDRFDVVWVPSEERRLCEETRAFLESHRMTLTRPH